MIVVAVEYKGGHSSENRNSCFKKINSYISKPNPYYLLPRWVRANPKLLKEIRSEVIILTINFSFYYIKYDVLEKRNFKFNNVPIFFNFRNWLNVEKTKPQ